ncbi:unnamed protein product [Pedinophyceae sp. YPF-701]|nr:unnamed protein product [Pedinophyceae sp. YPF-701]
MEQAHFDNTVVVGDATWARDVQRKCVREATAALQIIETRITQNKGLSGGGVMLGRGGIALCYLHLDACFSDLPPYTPENEILVENAPQFSPSSCVQQAQVHLAAAEKMMASKQLRASFLEGLPGVLAIRATCHSRSGHTDRAVAAVRELEQLYDAIDQQLAPGECEVLYGRSGYLWSLCAVEDMVGSGTVNRELVTRVASRVIATGLQNAGAAGSEGARFGLWYEWHGKAYLGAAHGLCGILSTLLFAHTVFGTEALGVTPQQFADIVHRALRALLDERYASGNLPSSHGSRTDRLVQWCHGAPGLMMLLAQALPFVKRSLESPSPGCPAVPEQEIRDALAAASEVVWQRGLLRKGCGLCHGIAGNAYAFLAAFRATSDPTYLHRATAFASFMADSWRELADVPDRPFSLYEGLAGAVCLWFDMLRPLSANMPGFEADASPTRYSVDSTKRGSGCGNRSSQRVSLDEAAPNGKASSPTGGLLSRNLAKDLPKVPLLP